MSLLPLEPRRVSKEDILAGESPGLFWSVDEPTGLTKQASAEEGRSRRTSNEEMFKSSILAGQSPGLFWATPAKGGEDILVPALPAEEMVLQYTPVLDKVSTQKASNWARVRDEVLSGQSPGLFWAMPPDESGPLKAKKVSTQKASKWAQVREEILSGQFWLSEKLSESPSTHVRPRSRGLRRALK